jgi:hypothetical protein
LVHYTLGYHLSPTDLGTFFYSFAAATGEPTCYVIC